MRRIGAAIAIALYATTALAVPPAGLGAFPGANGLVVFVTDSGDKQVIATIDIATREVDYLTTPAQTANADGNPRWSPGGKFVVFARYNAAGNGDIWTMNADGSAQKRLTNTASDDDWPGYSADGSRIVFSSNRAGNYEIYTMKLDGTDLKRLTTNAATDVLPVWSPNNDRIAFSTDRTGTFEIYTMSPSGANAVRESGIGGPPDLEPAWSAAGDYIYFTRVHTVSDTSIWKVNVVGGGEYPVVGGSGLQVQPVARPDGVHGLEFEIVFATNEVADGDIAFGDLSTNTILTDAHAPFADSPDLQPLPAFPLVDARFSTYRTDIEWVYGEGITVGCSAERYCPNDPVTRGQMATFLVRALGLTGTPADAFDDDDGTTHEADINRLYAAGITSGCGANAFCPTAPVLRDQMASFLSRALELTGTPANAFVDDNGNTHELNINRIAAAGITNGCNTAAALYCPSDNVTRGQMAAFLRRAFEE